MTLDTEWPRGRPLGTVFFGSGAFGVPILEALASRPDIKILAVVTPPDGRSGRSRVPAPVPTASAARERGLPLLQFERIRADDAVTALARLAPDLGILADYGQLIPQVLIDLPAHGILNIHPSLLPRHRGATPVPATILSGDSEAGVAIMQMDAGLDTGPVIATRSWPLEGIEDAPELEARSAAEGACLLDEVIDRLLLGPLTATPQDPHAATLTRPLARNDGRLDPTQSAADLERRVRAMRPWPGTFLVIDGERLLVHEVEVAHGLPHDVPGSIVAHDDGLALVTSEGRLVLRTVQSAGGRRMPGPSFVRGRPSMVGSRAQANLASELGLDPDFGPSAPDGTA